jgi:pyruvate dehydrogenase E1 component alpha subunit
MSAAPDLLDHALSVAAAKRLPILFVCQNTDPLEPQNPTKPLLAPRNSAGPLNGVPTVVVDGNDVVAVYRVATEAITHARKGSGPTVIECVSFRHDGSATLRSGKLRSLDQRHGLRSVDPILIMESYLTRKGLFSRKIKREVADRFSLELDAAIKSLNS